MSTGLRSGAPVKRDEVPRVPGSKSDPRGRSPIIGQDAAIEESAAALGALDAVDAHTLVAIIQHDAIPAGRFVPFDDHASSPVQLGP